MIEEILITARHNDKVDPFLSIWTWEISVYLFLGGMTAGMMIFAAWAVISNRGSLAPFASSKLALWAPVVLSIGMTTLGMAGGNGGDMLASGLVDHCLVVETDSIHRVQEVHVTCYHILWDLAHTLLADHRGRSGAVS